MARELSDDEVRRSRVAAQLLHRPGRGPAIADLVGRLVAVQAQDIGAAPLALRVRSRGLTAADVAAAREDRSIVRAWGPRGTLHLVATNDLPWLGPLFGPQWINHSLRRLAQEGVMGTTAELVRVTDRALAGQGPLTKAQLGERLAKLGRPAKGQGIVHLAALAAAHGKVVLGPDRAGKPTYVLAADWLPSQPPPDNDRGRALAELARRYLRAHAPAGPEDLAAWSGLGLGDARAAWATVGSELTEVRHRDRPLWRARRGGPRPADVPVSLLPAFDEYLLGWRDRGLIVADAHARTVLPGGGILRPAVLAHGRVVGTWRVIRRPGADAVAANLFKESDGIDGEALRAEADDVARFAG